VHAHLRFAIAQFGSAADDTCAGVIVEPTGDIVFAGTTKGPLFMPLAGSTDIVLARLSARTGNLLSVVQYNRGGYGNGLENVVTGLAMRLSANVVIAGWTGERDFDPRCEHSLHAFFVPVVLLAVSVSWCAQRRTLARDALTSIPSCCSNCKLFHHRRHISHRVALTTTIVKVAVIVLYRLTAAGLLLNP
jgi:hypothetical protein